jgi:hypothetical protein
MTKYTKLYNIFIELISELGNIHFPIPENDPNAMCLECDVAYPCDQVKILLESLMEMDRIHG